MTSSAAHIWRENLREELEFWREWLTMPEFAAAREPRLAPEQILPHWIRDLIDAAGTATDNVVRVLDVGSGPLSTLGTTWPGHEVLLTACDPLANEYNALLAECGLASRARIEYAIGEELTQIYPEAYFDFVHSANALDHAYDPLRCMQNMLSICKPGGTVAVISVENEGERQQYCGLHRWNFTVQGENLRLWNREHDILVHEQMGSAAELHTKPIDHGNDLPMFLATLRRLA